MTKTAGAETVSVRVRLTCVDPPPRDHEGAVTEFGVQDKRLILHTGSPQPDGSIVYKFELTARHNPRTGKPSFLGPYIFGTIDDPFLYLGWRIAGSSGWIKRSKVMLGSITMDQVTRGEALQARVRSQGAAARATLLDQGWQVTRRSG